MANIGLKNYMYGVLDESGATPKWGEGKTFGKAIDCKVSADNNSAELYADDGLAESDYSFKKATVTIGVDDDDTAFAEVLGHSKSSEGGEIIYKDTDVAPYVGFGRIITKVKGGVYKYKVEFLCKVKFKEPSTEETTKGESIEFKTPSIEGTAMLLADGTWRKAKTCDTYEAAQTYLTGLFTKTF
mgnify:FL=1|jgi:phi13 family phage major tail protein